MQPRPHETVLRLGPALICWQPPAPHLWQTHLTLCPGPASLCLNLLPLARLRWEGVACSDGRPARTDADSFAALPMGCLEPLLRELCPPWLDGEQEAQLAALRRHLEGKADFPGLSCAQCREQEEQGEAPPDCAACPLPRAPRSASTALALEPWLDAPPWLLDGMLAELCRGLPPPVARPLRAQLLLLARRRGMSQGAGHCPLSAAHDTF